ncbi:hypothetical protein KW782_02800 [Candidatus Parcubacteria bacterium]|nr:hypothetical protein [Candidatus Parcubacteria bacterium]
MRSLTLSDAQPSSKEQPLQKEVVMVAKRNNTLSKLLREFPWLWAVSDRWDITKNEIKVVTLPDKVLTKPNSYTTVHWWMKTSNTKFDDVMEVETQKLQDGSGRLMSVGKHIFLALSSDLEEFPFDTEIDYLITHQESYDTRRGERNFPHIIYRAPKGTTLMKMVCAEEGVASLADAEERWKNHVPESIC